MPGSAPKVGDWIIRDVTPGQSGAYLLADAVTLKTVAGPFCSITDAAAYALARRRDGKRLWRENRDDRGRVLGEPFLIPLEQMV